MSFPIRNLRCNSLLPISAVCAVLAMAVLAAPRDAPAQSRELAGSGDRIDGIIAVVDDGVVLRSEFDRQFRATIQDLLASQAQLPPEQRGELPSQSMIERQVLEQLIVQQIQIQRAFRLVIVVSNDALNEAIAAIAEGVGLTLDEFTQALALEGIDYATFREDTWRTLVFEQLKQIEVIDAIVVTPREIELCVAREKDDPTRGRDYNVSQILIGIPANPTREDVDKALAVLTEIYERLEAGVSFADLAILYSDGPYARQGGSLGWYESEQLSGVFAEAVFALEPGDYSQPVQTGNGLHIVRLNSVRATAPILVAQTRARQILLRPNEVMSPAAVRERLLELRESILEGEDFAAIARSVSEDVGSAITSGDLGWTERGRYAAEFEDVIDQLEIGELSQPFETRYGWHIAEVLERRDYDTTNDTRAEECAEQIRAGRRDQEEQIWLQRIRDEAFVEIRR